MNLKLTEKDMLTFILWYLSLTFLFVVFIYLKVY